MRRVLALLLATAALAAAAATAAEPQVALPQDQYAHPGSSIEWWYFTADVRDPAGTPYSVFFTLFSSSGFVIPVAQVRNLETGALVGHSEGTGLALLGKGSLDASAGGMRLQYDQAADTWRFTVVTPSLHVTLSQHPLKPYALHGGGTGVIHQSVAGTSHYYSATRMGATGTLRLGGKTVPLTGQSWFDHQWGAFRSDPRAFNWNWFSCRFDNDTELMLYQFVDRKTGRSLAPFASGTFVRPDGHGVPVTGFEATALTRKLTAAGRTWPLDWQLRIPNLRLSETVRSLVPDQLVRNKLLPTFWEGAASARGTQSGICFVELSRR